MFGMEVFNGLSNGVQSWTSTSRCAPKPPRGCAGWIHHAVRLIAASLLAAPAGAQTLVDQHGALRIEGDKVVDSHGSGCGTIKGRLVLDPRPGTPRTDGVFLIPPTVSDGKGTLNP